MDSEKILFVDDEQTLLNSFTRSLEPHCKIVTACSGMKGLEAIREAGPFSVIVSDMRMPGMDGISFIREARLIAPESTFMMLTGNQDLSTAVEAVNRGAVFRYLNKPCAVDDLLEALGAATRQHQLVKGEKELLRNTFLGAVNLVTDILEASDSEFCACASRVSEVAESLRAELGLADRWEYRLASRVGLIGVALMDDAARNEFAHATGHESEWMEHLACAAGIGKRLLARIPRVTQVAEMVGGQSRIDGSATWLGVDDDRSLVMGGATVLRLAAQADRFARQGCSADSGILKIAISLPHLDDRLERALTAAWPDDGKRPFSHVAFSQVEEGMVLAESILADDGSVLVSDRRRLTQAIIEKLRTHVKDKQKLTYVKIYDEDPNALESGEKEMLGAL